MKFLTPEMLVGIFAIHVIAFTIAYVRKRNRRYLLTITTFTLLTASYILKSLEIRLEVSGIDLATGLRHLAWTMLAITTTLLVTFRIRNRKMVAMQHKNRAVGVEYSDTPDKSHTDQ